MITTRDIRLHTHLSAIFKGAFNEDYENLFREDKEIVGAVLGGEGTENFEELYKKYAGRIYNKCLFIVKTREAAEDLTHDVFIKAFLALSQFKGQSKFSTWLYSITYNCCMDYLRQARNLYRDYNQPLDTDYIEENENELFDIDSQVLKILMDELHPEPKMLLLMKYLDDMSISQIAQTLGIGESAAKMRLKRARESLLKLYTNHQDTHEKSL